MVRCRRLSLLAVKYISLALVVLLPAIGAIACHWCYCLPLMLLPAIGVVACCWCYCLLLVLLLMLQAPIT